MRGIARSGSGSSSNGLEALREYMQTKGVVVAASSEPFDWFEQTGARYS